MTAPQILLQTVLQNQQFQIQRYGNVTITEPYVEPVPTNYTTTTCCDMPPQDTTYCCAAPSVATCRVYYRSYC